MPARSRRSTALLAALSAAPWILGTAEPGPPPSGTVLGEHPSTGAVRYDRDVRPLLSDRCFRCHGPDPAERRAGLRLDVFDGATADLGGTRAIVPGDASASELIRRVTSDDPDERMPPADGHKPRLTPDEVDRVRRWIDAGAVYEEHWSFVPPVRPAVPDVEDASWPRGAVDRFVLAELERHGLAPNPPADRATLVRRVFLDLTGLPPTLAELDRFLADERPDAFERQVERLLTESPYVERYAERMTVPWLDAARYADTSGIHMDAGRQIWAWRDWVLRAYRDGMPFDRFLTEQLAGDLLPDATRAQRIASGFNRNHVTTDEGGAIAEEYLVEYAVDRTATTGAVFLGLTLGCARCHDHKYDPIRQTEFYELLAFFDSIDEPGLYSQLPDPNRAFEPFLVVAPPESIEREDALETELAAERAAFETPLEGEARDRAAFFDGLRAQAGLRWAATETKSARSEHGATTTIEGDGSVRASGPNPDHDVHVIELETAASELRLVALEALVPPGDEPGAEPDEGRVGRAPNGNAVLESIHAEAISLVDPTQRQGVRFVWAWADVEQLDGDFRVVNALADDGLGWAVDGHRTSGARAALFLAAEPFGFEGGTRVVVRLDYDSPYAQHVFARTRLTLGTIDEAGLDVLGSAQSGWYATAPFTAPDGDAAWSTEFGPEALARLDTTTTFGEDERTFNYVDVFRDDRLNRELGGGIGATYVAKRVFVPSARTIEVALGSDDGFRLYVDGELATERRIDRGLAADQDRAELELDAGTHTLTTKVVNTGGPSGYSWRTLRRPSELAGPLLAAALPARARTGERETELAGAWRLEFSPVHRAHVERIGELEAELAELRAGLPRTMVMEELDEPRETFVLRRGQYDQPDRERPVTRDVPDALGPWPDGAPRDRLGLARWMTSPDHPLVARVAVNRLWELVFGTGLVETSEDFGMQGAWPSHPELLDWLAVEFRESGWDTKALLARLVTSSTYRQSSRARTEVRADGTAVDPDRLLARTPRRRLGAEEIRDSALHIAGLLVEELGGPSVKPYQPDGLWREVAMPQSNTRTFERGEGSDLWRRSLYTYWKRAAPPPSMLIFDAPTREFCTIRRGHTATPLQALVLWNDEQFVEAARMLAARTLLEADDDAERVARMFRRCTAREPSDDERRALLDALAAFRDRYRDAPEDARALLEVGTATSPEVLDPTELAAWTMVANALFSLDATISKG